MDILVFVVGVVVVLGLGVPAISLRTHKNYSAMWRHWGLLFLLLSLVSGLDYYIQEKPIYLKVVTIVVACVGGVLLFVSFAYWSSARETRAERRERRASARRTG